MSNRYYHAGFSLLELLLVMVIIGMAVAVVVPRLSNSEVTILKAQTRKEVAKLNNARRSAIVEGKQKVVSFHEGKDANRGVTVQLAGNYLSEDEEEESKTFEIIFYPEGGSSGGAIVLIYKYHKAKITVSPITGKVESEILDHEEDSGGL